MQLSQQLKRGWQNLIDKADLPQQEQKHISRAWMTDEKTLILL